ncbi:MAG: sugar transferase, partial [Ilumatobacteraceae bacterium]
MTSELVPWTNGATAGETIRGGVAGFRRPAPVVAIPTASVPRPSGVYIRLVKPLLDRLLAVGALVVAAVPMAAIAGVVALTMGRPVLFRQQRIGLDGEPFEVLKFRTMRPDRRATRLDVIHDRRRTHKS